MKKIHLLCGIIFALTGCMKLDDFLHDNEKLTSYEPLSTSVIPDSAKEFVTLTSNGKKIYGYFIKSNGELPNYTIFYNHGNFEHLKYYWDRAEFLYRTGCNVFIYDYEGYGMSEGEPTEENMYTDGRTALTYLLNRPDVVDSNIIFYGFSLGNVVIYELASKDFTSKRFISEAPFASGDALTTSGTVLNIPSSYVAKGEYRNDEKAKNIHAAFLLLWAEKDKKFTREQGDKIFSNANQPKFFLEARGAGHSDIPQALGVENYLRNLKNFILFGVPELTR